MKHSSSATEVSVVPGSKSVAAPSSPEAGNGQVVGGRHRHIWRPTWGPNPRPASNNDFTSEVYSDSARYSGFGIYVQDKNYRTIIAEIITKISQLTASTVHFLFFCWYGSSRSHNLHQCIMGTLHVVKSIQWHTRGLYCYHYNHV